MAGFGQTTQIEGQRITVVPILEKGRIINTVTHPGVELNLCEWKNVRKNVEP